MNSKLKIVAFFLVSSVFLKFQCRKDFAPQPILVYQFSEKFKVSPYKKLYNIGDTIWLDILSNDKTLFDYLSNQNVRNDTTYISSSFLYQERYTLAAYSSDTLVKCITSGGNSIKLTTSPYYYNTLEFNTNCNSISNSMKIGFVPIKAGIFSINLSNGIVNKCPTKAVQFPYSIFKLTYDLVDCNKDVYLSIPPVSRGESVKGYTENLIDNKLIYILKVE